MADAQSVVDDILAGHYDGDLADFIAAARQRVTEGATSLRWRITFDGDTWDEDTITVGEMRFVEQFTGKTWRNIESPMSSAAVLAAFIVAHLHKVDKMPLAEAIDKVDALTAGAAVDLVSEYEVVTPAPKDGSTASTN
jgi:hypothetical protein